MRTVCIIVVLLLLVCIFIGIINAETYSSVSSPGVKTSDSGGETITILDDRGQYITIPYPVRHVVFLVENAMNSMYAVGGAGQISGIGNIWLPEMKEPFFRAIDPAFDEKPVFTTDNGEIDLDALAKAKPDMVVLWSADWKDDIFDEIKNTLKIPVYRVYYTKLSDVSRANSVYAKIIGNESREAEVSGIMSEYTKKVTEKNGWSAGCRASHDLLDVE